MALSLHASDVSVPDLGDRSWIERIRAGDARALESVFRRLAPALCAFVYRYVRSREAAEDIVQDLFLVLWRQRSVLDVRGSLTTYLFTAARNRALNHLKRERIVLREEEHSGEGRGEAAVPPVDASVIEGELAMAVHEAVAQLPERTRLVFMMSRQQGMTYEQIAQTLGLSVKTVETQMGRALRLLRGSLHDLME